MLFDRVVLKSGAQPSHYQEVVTRNMTSQQAEAATGWLGSAAAGLHTRLQEDQARALYAHAGSGLAMSAIASLLVAIMVATPDDRGEIIGWLCAMGIVLAVRAADLLFWYPKRQLVSAGGRGDIARYAAGVAAAALVWLTFPPLFFSSMTETGRAGSAVVLAAMAGGSPIMLGAVFPIAIGYCLSLIVPFSLMFLLHPGRVNAVLGALGLVDAVVMSATCKILHGRVMAFIRLARSHQLLTEEAVFQQGRAQAAQVALQEANLSLEARVQQRTADLQHEITERKSYARALARLASIDPLTGLLNRSMLSERLGELLKEREQSGSVLAVLFLDLDGFKQINDMQGHGVGDHVLQVVAARLTERCATAELARWGGDEFVVVTTRQCEEQAIQDFAASICKCLSSPIDVGPLQAGTRSVRVSATIGIALCPVHGSTQDELIGAADVSMYAGKNEGGGCITIFNPSLARLISERRLLEQSLRSAPADGALALHYQPIIDAHSGRCDVMEALLRWTHPELGRISPDIFIPIAEQSEQIVAIGRFVLQQACRAAMLWPGAEPPAVSVNISIAQILSGHLLEDVQEALDASGLPVHRLHLEITESMFVADYIRIMPVLEELRVRGVRLALDDFGTGFSSLARLKTLPIDTIKIDKAFVQVESEQGSADSQKSMLTKLGTNRLQGYLISRPMPADTVSGWLSSRVVRPELMSGGSPYVSRGGII